MPPVKMTTPIGTVKFPQISRPNQKGKYGLALVLDPADKEVQEFLEKVNQAVSESAYPKYDKIVKEDRQKDDAGELQTTGLIMINFISHFKINLFDAKKQPLEILDVGWGSKVRVAFTLKEFDVDGNKGLAKYIRGVQVLELKGGVSADSCGFGEEEGYEAPVSESDKPWDE